MTSFKHGNVEIAYLDEGEGEPIVLVHGFASTKEVNWVNPGWVRTLTRAGRRAIALDNRGHGQSTKFYDPADYHTAIMAQDVRALFDHLDLEHADVMGYSMGARITAFLAMSNPERMRSAIFGGLGIKLVHGLGLPDRPSDTAEQPGRAGQHPVRETAPARCAKTVAGREVGAAPAEGPVRRSDLCHCPVQAGVGI
jgi:pimeloyl-ACP methyl ester carboxylesterase